jgi:hypothetical protein
LKIVLSRVARSGSRFGRSRAVNARANQKKQIDKEDGDQDKSTDEDVWAKAKDGLVTREVRRRNVIVLRVVFVHADKLSCKYPNMVSHGKNNLLQQE